MGGLLAENALWVAPALLSRERRGKARHARLHPVCIVAVTFPASTLRWGLGCSLRSGETRSQGARARLLRGSAPSNQRDNPLTSLHPSDRALPSARPGSCSSEGGPDDLSRPGWLESEASGSSSGPRRAGAGGVSQGSRGPGSLEGGPGATHPVSAPVCSAWLSAPIRCHHAQVPQVQQEVYFGGRTPPSPSRLELRLPLSHAEDAAAGVHPEGAARVGQGAPRPREAPASMHLALLVARLWVCRSGPLRLAAVHPPALSPAGLTGLGLNLPDFGSPCLRVPLSQPALALGRGPPADRKEPGVQAASPIVK